MASLAALLQSYGAVLTAGDVIHVDTGVYNVGNIILGTNFSSITIQGPATGTGAVFDRGSISAGSNVFTFAGGDDITIDHLTLRNNNIAILALLNSGSDRLTISKCSGPAGS